MCPVSGTIRSAVWCAVAISVSLLAASGRAEAQPAPIDARRFDPLLGTGIALTSLASMSAFGIPLAADSSRKTAIPGWGMIGAGLGMGVVAVPTLLIGAATPAPRVGVRRSEGMLTAGVWLAGVGSSLIGLTIGQNKSAAGDYHNTPVALPFLIVGVGAVVAAVPLTIVGALPPAAGESRPRRLSSPARFHAGIILATAGAGFVGAGAYSAMWFGMSNSSMDAFIGSVPAIIGGTGLLAAGISLWAIGSRATDSGLAPSTPEIAFGPGSLSLRGNF